ncbi:hypothetical protein EOD42_25490 [Rhodovarius crocodyli]|uniref:Tyr recombinase domain-containing protein n=1 Tax=Rhodovarius crocodyli TaxID=1979269 RepID=A0A437LV16_9PROT|nr:tyrosine-type recombinase/integrase [Rhodovarius crocodyli]RVT89281.1 hypothetical protein EOD42_25490 [Rhodovarius crocodyli]
MSTLLVATVGADLPPPAFLSQVADRIAADLSLPATKRGEIRSALKALAAAAGQMLDAIPANATHIRSLLRHRSAAAAGLTRDRWTNVRSLVCTALLRVGVLTLPNRIAEPPSDAWQALLARVSGKSEIAMLGRFARCCTLLDVEPDQVNDSFMARYRTELVERSLVCEPEKVVRESAIAWNKASTSVEGWPRITLTVPNNSLYYTPGWATYPATLVADVERWLAGPPSMNIFAKDNPRRLREATVISCRDHLRLLLGGMVLRGVDAASLVDLRAAITPAHVETSCLFHHERAGGTINHVMAKMSGIALAIGTHHLALTGQPLERLQQIARELRFKKSGDRMTVRNKERLVAMGDAMGPDHTRLDVLLNMPQTLRSEVDAAVKLRSGSTYALALQYQVALILELCLTKSWRIRNLGNLVIGETLILRPDGRAVAIFREDQTKTRTPIETTLGSRATSMLHDYLRVHRPLLGDVSSAYLFPGKQAGRPKTFGAINASVKLITRERVGVQMTVHFFRHLAGDIILRQDLGALHIVQDHLHHADISTTKSFYVGMRSAQATRHYDELLEQQRSSIRGAGSGGGGGGGGGGGSHALAGRIARPQNRRAT